MTTRLLLIEKNEKAAATLINYFRLVGMATERAKPYASTPASPWRARD